MLFRLIKNAPACAETSAGRQMQVELREIPSAGAPLPAPRLRQAGEILPQQACPVLDTGKDERNPAPRGTHGRFSSA